MWVENMTKTPNILLTAVRQYQHNDCSGLLFGFDHDETIKAISTIRNDTLNEAIETINTLQDTYMNKYLRRILVEALKDLKE